MHPMETHVPTQHMLIIPGAGVGGGSSAVPVTVIFRRAEEAKMKRSKYTAHACIYMYMYIATAPNETKVQTLGAVALHATTDCTDDASIVGSQLGYSLVSCLVLHIIGYAFSFV